MVVFFRFAGGVRVGFGYFWIFGIAGVLGFYLYVFLRFRFIVRV